LSVYGCRFAFCRWAPNGKRPVPRAAWDFLVDYHAFAVDDLEELAVGVQIVNDIVLTESSVFRIVLK
jgi:hypothetical protein